MNVAPALRAVAYSCRALSRLAGRMAVWFWRLAWRLEEFRPRVRRSAIRLALATLIAVVLTAGREDA